MKRYSIMDKDEEGIYISFTDRYEAEEWLNTERRIRPGRVERDGLHIVERNVVTLTEIGRQASELNKLDDWGEDDSICLWWKFPIEEEPYVGSPLDVNFPNDVTHFTRIIIPDEPID